VSTLSHPPSLLLGTHNAGKVREIETILRDVRWRLRSLREFEEVGVAAENAPTYAENAILKAQFYARETGIHTLADDSGLEVAALGGAPGVLSARYAGEGASDADRRALLLSELARVENESSRLEAAKAAVADRNAAVHSSNRRARFVCVVAIATPDGTVLNTSEGMCEGKIIFDERGRNGFGYDPLFVPDGFEETFAELSDSIKNQISHRARALLKTRQFLTSNQALLDQQTSGS
jgi:XTP/dITP diphosphohydrolase